MSDESNPVCGLADSLIALEQFVVDNDDLLALEERIGKFNIFDALRIERVEIRHSNFLAWLLDPAESHGQGPLFLKAVLMDLLKQSSPDMRPMSPVELDGEELRGVEIWREWRNIDLLIRCEQPPFVIGIENKIDTGESKGQLEKYKKLLTEYFPSQRPLYVFLTTDGAEPSDDAWVAYSYADIHRVLEQVARSNAGAIGNDVTAFLEHYLRLIGSRFMDDPKLDELCMRIYANHRQALELIFERVGTKSAGLIAALNNVLATDPANWHVFNRTSKRIDFVPKSWTEWIPAICALPKWDPQMWIRWWVLCGPKGCHVIFEIGPASNADLRRRVIERLTSSRNEFGFKVAGKPKDKWTRLRRLSIASWAIDEEPEADELSAAFKKQIDKLAKELAGVPDALRPIFEN